MLDTDGIYKNCCNSVIAVGFFHYNLAIIYSHFTSVGNESGIVFFLACRRHDRESIVRLSARCIDCESTLRDFVGREECEYIVFEFTLLVENKRDLVSAFRSQFHYILLMKVDRIGFIVVNRLAVADIDCLGTVSRSP